MSHLDGIVIEVESESESGRFRITSDGRKQFESKVTLTEKGFEMLKQGYLCGRCLEDLSPLGAFPEQCPCCGFRVRELQARQLQQDFVGEEHLGSRLSLSDELSRLGEMWRPEDGI